MIATPSGNARDCSGFMSTPKGDSAKRLTYARVAAKHSPLLILGTSAYFASALPGARSPRFMGEQRFSSAFQAHRRARGCWHAIRIQDRAIRRRQAMEPIRGQSVAPETVASLRGGGRSTPVWWEAFDGEGSGRVRILRNPRPRPGWVGGVSQMSVLAASEALNLVMQDSPHRDHVSHSFAFFTGLCEKACAGAPSPALLTGRHK